MEKMKKSHPEIEISVPGVEYQNFGGYRLLMCTDPVKMALMDPESDFGQSIESYMGSSFLYLYNDLIDAGKWISHKTALILVLQYRTEQLVTEMLERDGLNIPGLTSTNYEDLLRKRGRVVWTCSGCLNRIASRQQKRHAKK